MKKTNVVFILSDDQGPWAMRCAGNNEIITPNLDKLAERGMRFENFFCASPVCSPARASILTGRIPSQHGILDWIAEGSVGENSIEYLNGQLAYTDILSENGYTCGLSGKWHLGDSIKPQKGFSHWYVHQFGGGPYYNAPMIRNGELITEPGYITDVITDDALNFLDDHSNDENPFYLSVHYTAPHSPWINEHPKKYLDMYEDCKFESCPQDKTHPWTISWLDGIRKNAKENLKGYFASITAMDMNIGRILDKLDELGITENTLICFLSDNGFSCGQHGFWGKGNGTFPLNMYDTTVKIPAIMSQPGVIPQGIVCDSLLSQYDFMPTLLDYLGFANPEANKLPGKSFAPILKGEKTEVRENVVIYDEYGPVRMVRTKEWKYIHRYPYGPHELYDLINDPNEDINLINDKSRKDILISMKAMLDNWFIQYVNPRLDGTHEAVTGGGQLNLAGPDGFGKKAFAELDE